MIMCLNLPSYNNMSHITKGLKSFLFTFGLEFYGMCFYKLHDQNTKTVMKQVGLAFLRYMLQIR